MRFTRLDFEVEIFNIWPSFTWSSYILGCANKDLDGSLGPLGKFIEYCRIVALLPVILYTQITDSSATILHYSMNLPKGPKDPSKYSFTQPNIYNVE